MRSRALQKINEVLFLFSQALNNLQSTYSGFGFINSENVFKVSNTEASGARSLALQLCENYHQIAKPLKVLCQFADSTVHVATTA